MVPIRFENKILRTLSADRKQRVEIKCKFSRLA